ncbi:MAG TPA: GGDEF domain-containing protein [Gammaproteobacteria bacterium]|nr:GGDEF domain-containing protein [Gammaproteobacteria bacterium]
MPVLDRSEFLAKLHQMLRGLRGCGSQSVLLLADIRQLRVINGRLGYGIGDRLVERVGEIIRTALRPKDLLGHLGGGCFGMFLPRLPGPEVAQLAIHRIDEHLGDAIALDDVEVPVRLMYGQAWYPDHARDVDRLLNDAELALAAARDRGGVSLVFEPDMREEGMLSTALVAELRLALEQQQLELYYQPKVTLATGRTSSLEALVRWTHPGRGILPPGQFMPTLENSHLALPFTEWSLNLAMHEVAVLGRRFPGIQVAVNLSANVLYAPNLVAQVQAAMAIWNVPASQLALEVTESAMMRDPRSSLETLRRFADAGIRLSIDDFGTGYSSLAYLRELPVNELKIDKSFIMGTTQGQENRKIVLSIIELAHNLDIGVVAEGVEQAATLDWLREAGCDLAQGFYFARPMPRKRLEQWLKASEWGFAEQASNETGARAPAIPSDVTD